MRRLLILLTACGDGLTPSMPDAGVDDQRGLVSLTLVASGERVAQLPVFFQNRDSSLVLSTLTDGEGRANAFMDAGGFVSVVMGRGNSAFIFTYAGVEPGDELTVDRDAPSATVELDVKIPATAGATAYHLYSSCSGGTPIDISGAELMPVTVAVFGCDPTESFLAVALIPGGIRRYLFRGAVTLQPFSSLVFDGTYQDIESSMVTVRGAPAGIARGFVSQDVAGINVPATFADLDLVDGSGGAIVALPHPPDATVATRINFDASATIGVHRAAYWGQASPAVSLDLGGGLRPYTRRPWFERTTSSIRWEESESGLVANTVLVGVGWARSSTVFNYQWMLAGPRTADPSIAFPVLPERELNPTETETPNPFTLVNVRAEGGYDRIRPRFLNGWSAGDRWPVDGASGSVIYEELGIGEL